MDGMSISALQGGRHADLCASGNLREPHLHKGSGDIDYVDYTCFCISCSIRYLGRIFKGHDETA